MISNKELMVGILPCKILVTGKTAYVELLLFARLLHGMSRAGRGKGKMVVKWVRASANWSPCGLGRTHEVSRHLEASDFVNVSHLQKQLPAHYCGSQQALGQESEKPKEETWWQVIENGLGCCCTPTR